MRTVIVHLTKYGPSGVPKGLVEAQKRGKGKTPCLHKIEVSSTIALENQKVAAPSTLPNDARLAQEDSDKVAERAECDEEVEAADRTAGAEDFLEEQAGGDLCRVFELCCRNCWYNFSECAYVHFGGFSEWSAETHQRQSRQYLPTGTK